MHWAFPTKPKPMAAAVVVFTAGAAAFTARACTAAATAGGFYPGYYAYDSYPYYGTNEFP